MTFFFKIKTQNLTSKFGDESLELQRKLYNRGDSMLKLTKLKQQRACLIQWYCLLPGIPRQTNVPPVYTEDVGCSRR